MTFLKQSKELHISLTQIWVGLLGLRLPPPIPSKSITNTYLVNIWYQDPLNFAEVSILKSAFWAKVVLLHKAIM